MYCDMRSTLYYGQGLLVGSNLHLVWPFLRWMYVHDLSHLRGFLCLGARAHDGYCCGTLPPLVHWLRGPLQPTHNNSWCFQALRSEVHAVQRYSAEPSLRGPGRSCSLHPAKAFRIRDCNLSGGILCSPAHPKTSSKLLMLFD